MQLAPEALAAACWLDDSPNPKTFTSSKALSARTKAARACARLFAHTRDLSIVQRIKKALVLCKTGRRHLAPEPPGLVVDYTLGQWTMLEVFLPDERVEINNNVVENAICPTAIGK